MAIATGTAIALGISAAASGVQLASGISRKRKAKRALKNFKRQELKNVTRDLKVSTLGAELQAQEQARRFSTSVDALRSGGVRGVVGGLGRQEQLQQLGTQRISADLDRQQRAIDAMAAQDEAKIREMREARESGAIAGLGKEIASADAQLQQGAMGLAGVAASAASFIPGTIGGSKDAAGAAADFSKFTNSTAPAALNAVQSVGGLGAGLGGTGAGLGGATAGLGGPSTFAGMDAMANQSLSNMASIQSAFPSAYFSTQNASFGNFAVNANVPQLGIQYGLNER